MAVLALALVAASAGAAHGHQTAVKYVDIAVDGANARVRFTVAPSDVTEPLALPPDAQPAIHDATVPAVASYVAAWLALEAPEGRPCQATNERAGPDLDHKFVVVAWDVACSQQLTEVTVDLSRFFAIDQRHEAIVSVHRAGEQVEPQVVRSDRGRVTIHVGGVSSLASWVGLGIHHIYGGTDHICFVLALLLVVVLSREDGRWRVRTPLAALRSTAMIVTSFTIAHSITLIAAALGWVSLPSRLVESAIALSIVYTAVENMVRPDVRWRFALAFGFGLVHGLGFASVLADHLPPTHVIAPLLGFNVGVELGQLSIVAIALPVCWLVARRLGADRYRRVALAVAGAPLILLGIKWLIERVFEV
ncbi:MAG: HupE/UreJ family protein [Kofleriaceae bacterium]